MLRRILHDGVRFDAIEVFQDCSFDDFGVRQIKDRDTSSNLILYFTEGISILAPPSVFFDRFCKESRGILCSRADSIDVLDTVDTLFQK
ncbi:hypothetical protein AQ725_17230 [Burkholderia pseudomallei]|nr:hypothetical protein AQ725_17230 [Burkholderia pseudomallei]